MSIEGLRRCTRVLVQSSGNVREAAEVKSLNKDGSALLMLQDGSVKMFDPRYILKIFK